MRSDWRSSSQLKFRNLKENGPQMRAVLLFATFERFDQTFQPLTLDHQR
ncbi:hypothetical protein PMI17_02162 [Pantoea sp. GM01]|nr:hypothetical protein PMI17_02162 [Pantoea sp. GM01]